MGKSLKVWLWVLIASLVISIISEFICVEGLIGFVYAVLSLAAILAVVQIFKLNKIGAYVFLGLRVVESLITFIFLNGVVNQIPDFARNLTTAFGGIYIFAIIVAVLRLVSAGLTVLFCELSKSGDE